GPSFESEILGVRGAHADDARERHQQAERGESRRHCQATYRSNTTRIDQRRVLLATVGGGPIRPRSIVSRFDYSVAGALLSVLQTFPRSLLHQTQSCVPASRALLPAKHACDRRETTENTIEACSIVLSEGGPMGARDQPPPPGDISLLEIYRRMVLVRALERTRHELWLQRRLVGELYLALGQEATSVGLASALRRGDWLWVSRRGLSLRVARGLAPAEALEGDDAGCAPPGGFGQATPAGHLAAGVGAALAMR